MNLAARLAQLFHDVFGTYPVLTWTVTTCLVLAAVLVVVGLIAQRR